jgi:hypothetical protein
MPKVMTTAREQAAASRHVMRTWSGPTDGALASAAPFTAYPLGVDALL